MVTTNKTGTALITGASSGVGYELTTRLLGEGWDVLTLTRSPLPERAPIVAASHANGRLRSYRADLADPTHLTAALAEIRAREPSLELLVNNAAVSLDRPAPAPSGRDLHFEVNVLAPYAITTELLPLLTASGRGTIVNVASNALLTVKQLSLAELQHPTRFKKLFGSYAASKLALALWTHEAARSLPPGVTLRSVCPGPNDTPMTRGAGMPAWIAVLVPLLFRHPRRGAARLHAAAFGRDQNGVFLHRGKPTKLPHLAAAPAVLAAVRAAYTASFPSSQAAA
jgi:NAD(P)-dependent dehydrogenase (short-subunit alcohol dehydrogenase family)